MTRPARRHGFTQPWQDTPSLLTHEVTQLGLATVWAVTVNVTDGVAADTLELSGMFLVRLGEVLAR